MRLKRIFSKTLAIALAAALLPWQPVSAAGNTAGADREIVQEAGKTDEILGVSGDNGVQSQASAQPRGMKQSQDIKASVVGGSGDQKNYAPEKCLIATNSYVSTNGSENQAAFVAGQTATGTAAQTGGPLGGTRIGYLEFALDTEMSAEDIARATVTANVEGVNGNIGSHKTKAGLFRVTSSPGQVKTSDAATFPAKDGDYSYYAAAYSDRMVGGGDSGEITFDVTKMVRAAYAEGADHASFRLQTVISGFSIWASGDKAPTLKIEKTVTYGASGAQEEDESMHISTASAASEEGSGTQAAFAANETATGSKDATGTPSDEDRVAYLKFVWDAGITAEEVSRATVNINVAKAEEGLGAYQTKAALFEVEGTNDIDTAQESTYPAKGGDYSKGTAVYSNEWIARENVGVKTFDVTNAVKSAISAGKNYAEFRLQTVISGFYVSVSPGSGPSLQIGNAAEENKVENVYDLIESTYQITDSKSGKKLVFDGMLKGNADIGQGTDLLFGIIRYGDWDGNDSLNNVPVALQAPGGSYLALAKGNRAGTEVKVTTQIADDRSQQFVLQKSESWSKEHLAYKIYHPLSHMYLGYGEEAPHTLQAYGASAPEYDFVFARKGYSELGRVRSLPGYQKLTSDEKKRVFDLLGGIAAYSLSRYGGTGQTTESYAYRNMKRLRDEVYAVAASASADDQASKIRSILQGKAFSGQTNWYDLPTLPGADGIKLEIRSESPGKYDFWRGTMLEGVKYQLVITDNIASQTVNLYIQNNSKAITNGKNLMEAIKRIPYPLRKNIKNMKVRNDSANSYNCSDQDFYMRIDWIADVKTIAMYMTHEFGHSMDYSYGVNSSGRWGNARNKDIAGVSEYGNNNGNEDMADFGRLYFQSYGKINMMYALRQMYPNRYKEYVATLKKTGYSDILQEKTDEIEQGAKKDRLRELIAVAGKKQRRRHFTPRIRCRL